MTERVKTWKILALCAVLSGGLTISSPGQAPNPITAAAEKAAAEALDQLNSGNLGGAENSYAQLLSQYPTAGVAPEATFRLGYIQYMQGEYAAAVETLKKLQSPPATPAIKTAGDALIPQVAAAEAAAMAPNDPGRKQAYEEAIKEFDAFIAQYPTSQAVVTANYGRAAAYYQNQDYASAEKALKENLQRFPGGDSILDSEDLLAVVLTAEGGDMLKGEGEGDTREAAFAKFNDALHYLADIINRHTDVPLSNDAQYQIGEVLYDRASVEEDPQRKDDVTHALEAYRAVESPDAVAADQQEVVTAAQAAAKEAVAGGNAAAVEETQRRLDRENAKLSAAKKAADDTYDAQLRMAACYFLLGKYDESRVLLRYLRPFAYNPDQPDKKKEILYYTTLSYASEGLMERAESSYGSFVSAFGSAPIGESLPLALGAAFLTGSNSQPDKAITYFQQEKQLYPQSPLVGQALNGEAAAMVKERRYADAIAAYQEFLATHPAAPLAAAAEQGIATIYQETGRLEDAVKQFQKVADDFPGTPMAEQSAFYSAALEASVDTKVALPRLQAYVAKYAKGKYTAQAMMLIAQVQETRGDTDAAVQTFKDLIANFPDSDYAQQAYFQQASMLGKAGRTADMVALLKEFIDAYPDSKDIFGAYDTIGQTQVEDGQTDDAVATYREMADQHGDNPMAPMALCRIAELLRGAAAAQGHYQALDPAQRIEWDKNIEGSRAAVEQALDKYPDADQVGTALRTLLGDEQMELDAQAKTPEAVDSYFRGLASKYIGKPGARTRILFTQGVFTYGNDPVKGLAAMDAAYDPTLVYAPADLDLYGTALIAQGRADQAYKIYEKIAKDYPMPAGAAPAQAPAAISDAQATALFGMASALDKEGKTDDAGKLFTQLKLTYPWSPKVLEANYGIAKAMVQQNKLGDATRLLSGIVLSRNATAALRAHAFLLIADIQAAKGNITGAIDSYLKTALEFGGVPDAAAEGLWRGGQMLEKQADTLTEDSTPKRSVQIGKAKAAYKELETKYPDSQFVPQAQDRLKELGDATAGQ